MSAIPGIFSFLFFYKSHQILLNPFLLSFHANPISRSLVLRLPLFWASPHHSTQLAFIKRLLCAKLRTLRWAEETSVLPAPIMYSLKEELGPPHIPGLPSPQLLLNTSAGPSIHSQPSASRRATEKRPRPCCRPTRWWSRPPVT